jgi:hypothetical protein
MMPTAWMSWHFERCPRGLPILALALALPCAATGAQSNLSVQGFGYPTGQMSSRAEGSGGAVGEIDPLSPLNPASIAAVGARLLYFQLEPEFRTVTTANGSEATTTNRYPVVFGAIPVGKSWVVSLGSSTLLDRTSSTSFSTQQDIGTQIEPMTTTERIDGAMNDVRAAAAFTPLSWLRVGVGLDGITGHNLISLTQHFEDSTEFASFTQKRVLGFRGGAVSAGAQAFTKNFVAAGSFRHGGALHLDVEDTLIASARVPDRFGLSLAYTGLANSAIAVRTSHDSWSSLGSLGSSNLVGVDAWDTSIGADIAGPRLGSRILFLRGGFRDRTLPFEAAGHKVAEHSFSGGLGTSFANSRVLADLALIHASRSAPTVDASEHAWTLSVGISVRP